jgi:hypothetical protein
MNARNTSNYTKKQEMKEEELKQKDSVKKKENKNLQGPTCSLYLRHKVRRFNTDHLDCLHAFS